MLLNGINHVATLTNDTDRLHDFYREVFQARVVSDMQAPEGPGIRLSIIDIGGGTALNVFQVDGSAEGRCQQSPRHPVCPILDRHLSTVTSGSRRVPRHQVPGLDATALPRFWRSDTPDSGC